MSKNDDLLFDDCEFDLDGDIETHERIICQALWIPISANASLVTIRTRGKDGINTKKLKDKVGKFLENYENGIKSVSFIEVHDKEVDFGDFLTCDSKGVASKKLATCHGSVWNRWRGCRSKRGQTPCRRKSCSTVMRECRNKFDRICGGAREIVCWDCE